MSYYDSVNYWSVATYPRDNLREAYPQPNRRRLAWFTASFVPIVITVGCVTVSDCLRWSIGISDQNRYTLSVADSSLWSVVTTDQLALDVSVRDAVRFSITTEDRTCN